MRICSWLLVALLVGVATAEIVPIFPLLPNAQTGSEPQPIVADTADPGGSTPTSVITGSILPTEVFYYRIETYDNVQVSNAFLVTC